MSLSLIPGPPAASGLTPEVGTTAEDVVQRSADRGASADDPDGGPARRGPADRWYRAMGAALIACLVGCATVASGFDAGEPALRPPAPAVAAPVHVQVLQLNLCGSGFAGCYTGRSTAEAAAVIHVERPDVVTLNEVCHGDVPVLQRALADVVPGGVVTSAFHAALDGATGEAVRCRNGQEYGIGMVSRWPTPSGAAAGGGIYPIQDEQSSEGRAWLCLDGVATSAVAVCTTHLAHSEREVAGAQCRYLFGTIIPQVRARDGAPPVVLGGDLNLGSGSSPDLESCLPAGSADADDGGVQHVVATPELVVDSSRTIDMRGATDHPALLVTLAFQEPSGKTDVNRMLSRGEDRV
ncbi:endonuclease/exonuclease/phosphatase family protein [Pseudonocardia cypriaca]|uniref:Endonuclease/exonuclease/phosphatase family metal-dependent hydrolase n=1 Tax=Pseudonocardia cypriaca TaxID=882449 RepID=A0A543FS57_9PSEU|nr:endonuclease/exonuclease/phosphatase family protein [Pseudonocardia cypriaca]TQM36673.1 endonuclease/exonuclease/phosphatase family metal-dependent hydrolase [Pseudonocardia cypriaca]